MSMTVESSTNAGESTAILAGAYFARMASASLASGVPVVDSWKGWNQYIPSAPPPEALIVTGAEQVSMLIPGLVHPALLSPDNSATHCEGLSRPITSGP